MRRNVSLIVLLVCVAGFALGIAHLFKLRFETGDVYPPYSSLRAGPLGASALYESLSQLPGLRVNRDFRETDELPEGKNIAYLHLAGDEDELTAFPEAAFQKMQSFFNSGGRLIIALSPENSPTFNSLTRRRTPPTPASKSKNKDGSKSKPEKKETRDHSKDDEDEFYRTVSLQNEWGFHFRFRALKQGDNDAYEPAIVKNDDEPSLPDSMPWHSALVMTNLDDRWRVIYARGKDAVVAERHIGHGSLVVATDCYFTSNESLSRERHSALLAWMIGPSREVVFDEAHFGIVDNPGISMLMRNYHLQGLMIGLLVLAGLFIWKNSTSLLPPLQGESLKAAVVGKDSATGFVNLLRRHIGANQLLDVCVAEWKKSFGRGKSGSHRVARLEAALNDQNAEPAAQRNPIAAYRDICHALKPGTLATRNPELRPPS